MGRVVHRYMVVLGSVTKERAREIDAYFEDQKYIDESHKKAKEMFEGVAPVTDVHKSKANMYSSFAILPCGSKQGWDKSEEFIEKLCEFEDWLEGTGLRYEESVVR